MKATKCEEFFSMMLDSCYDSAEYPALKFLMQKWGAQGEKPFSGLRILVATPIFRNTLTEYRALVAGGAHLLVGCCGLCDANILEMLRRWNFEVVTPEQALAAESDGEFVDLVLDCAGSFSNLHPRIGAVELTRSGVHCYENAEYPVYVADSGIIKRIETSLGTGDGFFRALKELGLADLSENEMENSGFDGKKVVVFGSGKVGSGIALQGVMRGCDVSVVTDLRRLSKVEESSIPMSDFTPLLEQNGVQVVDCHDEATAKMLIEKADFVVMATGVKNAFAGSKLTDALLNSGAKLANMGVEDEFGDAIPAERVLNAKIPLNFMLEEPTHLKYIDASLALHVALGERLVLEKRGIVPVESAADVLRNPPQELESQLLMVTMQNGLIGRELCEMLGYVPEE